jgi:hypothetical protein
MKKGGQDLNKKKNYCKLFQLSLSGVRQLLPRVLSAPQVVMVRMVTGRLWGGIPRLDYGLPPPTTTPIITTLGLSFLSTAVCPGNETVFYMSVVLTQHSIL